MLRRPTVLALVVFDLDGTLVDSRGDIVRAANAGLVDLGLEPLDETTVAGFVGDGALSLMRRGAAEALRRAGRVVTEAELDALGARGVDRYVARYCERPIERTTYMPGAEALLEALRSAGLSVAVCTNKPRAATDAVLGALGLDRRLVALVAGGDLPEKKPHPAPLRRVLELAGVPPESALMVGDGPQDVGTARAAGVRSVAVSGGFVARDVLEAARPDHLVDSLHEAAAIVERLRAAR